MFGLDFEKKEKEKKKLKIRFLASVKSSGGRVFIKAGGILLYNIILSGFSNFHLLLFPTSKI